MNHRVSKTIKVKIPAGKVWEVLNDYGKVFNYAPAIKSSPIIGKKKTGLGAKRKVTFHQGASLVEEIVDYQDGRGYKMDLSELEGPFKSMQGEMWVDSIDADSSEITMAVDFQIKGGSIGWLIGVLVMKPVMKGALLKTASGLAYYSATGEEVVERLPPEKDLNTAIGRLG